MTDARRFRRFIAGDLEAAEARFDAARALNPELRPYLWQRGITKVNTAFGSRRGGPRTDLDAFQVLPGEVR